MLVPGLVSVTFRQLSAEQIIKLVSVAGLQVIEWGGDVHVPHGDIARATEVGKLTRDAGLETPTYGSYYRIYPEGPEEEFGPVLDTCLALGASLIRVWVGKKPYGQYSAEEQETIVAECRRLADLAGAKGVRVACEFHSNSVTETTDSALEFLKAVNHDNFSSYWQATPRWEEEEYVKSLGSMLPHLAALHIYTWDRAGKRLPLGEGRARWLPLLKLVSDASADDEIPVMIEFVHDGEPVSFPADAAALKSWCM
jgi:sugar phosphate isomerase/epimerase